MKPSVKIMFFYTTFTNHINGKALFIEPWEADTLQDYWYVTYPLPTHSLLGHAYRKPIILVADSNDSKILYIYIYN